MTLREQLIRDEGTRRFPYKDSQGYLTIGCGRNLEHNGLSRDEIEYLLANDIRQVQDQLSIAMPWTDALDEARRGVLQNMAYNMGLRGLLQFRKMLDAAQLADWETAAKEMLDSLWMKQVGNPCQGRLRHSGLPRISASRLRLHSRR